MSIFSMLPCSIFNIFHVEGLFGNLSESSDKTREDQPPQHSGLKRNAEPTDPSGCKGDPAPGLERQLQPRIVETPRGLQRDPGWPWSRRQSRVVFDPPDGVYWFPNPLS